MASQDSFTKSSEISFTSRYGKSIINGNRLLHETHFYGKDVDWDKVISTIIEKFPNGTAIYCHACSDGSEAYTIAIELINRLGWDKASKFFPIKARDVSHQLIDEAQKYTIGIKDVEVAIIKSRLKKGMRFEDFFLPVNSCEKQRKRYAVNGKGLKVEIPQYRISDKLKEAVNFRVDNINNINKTNFESSIVLLARNFVRYLSQEERISLPDKIFNALPKNSMLFTGSLEEKEFPINKELKSLGFIEYLPGLLEKKASNSLNFSK